jgi:hypothetical protein
MRKSNPRPRTFPSDGAARGMSRRRFLGNCAACAGAAGLMSAPSWLKAGFPGADAAAKLRIRVFYALHGPVQKEPDWPNVGFDFRPVMEAFNNELAGRLPDIAFIPTMAAGPEQAEEAIAEDKASPVDGYIVFQMNCWNRVVQSAAASGKPVLYADFPFAGSGGFLVYTAAFLRAGVRNVGFVGSSRFEDVAEAAGCFRRARAGGTDFDFAGAVARVRRDRTPGPSAGDGKLDRLEVLPTAEAVRLMRAAKLLAVRDDKAGPTVSIMGIPIAQIPFAEVNEAWASADKEEAQVVADHWIKTAAAVEGVSRDEIVNSAAMYLGMKAVLERHGAHGITINCLGGFYGGRIHAYPCLGFHELNNEGLVGGCECDTNSASAMTALGILTKGRPGYISDPVIDTAERRIIYAHCVASNKVFGRLGPANSFEILTHSEDRQGASVRSTFPTGYLTTSIQVSEKRKEILFHQARAVGNDRNDRACRTKLVGEPLGDIERLFTMWDEWGWHRVTFFGDLKEPVHALADAIGWTVVDEA